MDKYDLTVNYKDVRESLELILRSKDVLSPGRGHTRRDVIITALDDAVANNCGDD